MHKIKFAFRILAAVFAVLVISNTAMANEKSKIFVQLGHTNFIESVAFSPDGKYAVSGGLDGTIQLWDLSSGRTIRILNSGQYAVDSVAFSPDGRYIASGGGDDSIRLWDVETGREIKKLSGHTNSVPSVAFSPDGRYIVSASEDKTIKLWETSTGREIRTFAGHTHEVSSVAFSPDGKYIVSASRDKTIKLWETSTGREIRTFAGHSDWVRSVAFSPDGRYVVSGSSDHTVRFWDTSTGRALQIFNIGPQLAVIQSVAFSRDGKYVFAAIEGWGEGENLRAWEVETGKQTKIFKNVSDIRFYSIAVSPDGRSLLTACRDTMDNSDYLGLWDLASGREMLRMGGCNVNTSCGAVAFSPDGRYLLAEGPCGMLRLFDLEQAREVKLYGERDSDLVNGLTFSPDGKYILAARFRDKVVDVWEVASGKRISQFSGHKTADVVGSIAISPDGRYALSTDYYDLVVRTDNPPATGKVKLWEVATGRLVKELQIPLTVKGEFDPFKGRPFPLILNLDGAAFSADGRYALVRHYNNIILWDIVAGTQIKKDGSEPIGFPVFSVPGSLRLYAPDGGRALRAKSTENGCISPDGKYQLVSLPYKDNWRTILLYDISPCEGIIDQDLSTSCSAFSDKRQKKRLLATLEGHITRVRGVVFSPDGRQAASAGSDGSTRLWDIATGKEIAEFISFQDGEWIVITPEGYYNSSTNGDKQLNVRIGNRVYGIDQYRAEFYRPRIVQAALRGASIEEAVALVTGGQKAGLPVVSAIQNTEPPFVVIKSPEDGKKINSTEAEISLYIEDRNQTIKKVKVFVNGRAVTVGEGRGIKVTGVIPEGKKALDLKIPVHLDVGENLIEVIAFNGFSEGRKSIRLYSSAAQAKGKVILPNLWILSIGINRYQDKKLPSLSYAAADAEGIVAAFGSQKGKLFREINSMVINDGSRIKPTYENIIDNLNYLSKAGHNDVALLFIAGHGIMDDRGEFYFLPSDAVIRDDGTIKRSRAISWREIKSILDIPAKKLLFADTCHSEGVSGKKTRGVDSDRFVKELQEANAVIFTSSRGRELSQESDSWKHGAFTHALIEGIQGKADLIKDNKISMKELDAYVSETVPKITSGAQHPITNTPDGYVNFPVAIVK